MALPRNYQAVLAEAESKMNISIDDLADAFGLDSNLPDAELHKFFRKLPVDGLIKAVHELAAESDIPLSNTFQRWAVELNLESPTELGEEIPPTPSETPEPTPEVGKKKKSADPNRPDILNPKDKLYGSVDEALEAHRKTLEGFQSRVNRTPKQWETALSGPRGLFAKQEIAGWGQAAQNFLERFTSSASPGTWLKWDVAGGRNVQGGQRKQLNFGPALHKALREISAAGGTEEHLGQFYREFMSAISGKPDLEWGAGMASGPLELPSGLSPKWDWARLTKALETGGIPRQEVSKFLSELVGVSDDDISSILQGAGFNPKNLQVVESFEGAEVEAPFPRGAHTVSAGGTLESKPFTPTAGKWAGGVEPEKPGKPPKKSRGGGKGLRIVRGPISYHGREIIVVEGGGLKAPQAFYKRTGRGGILPGGAQPGQWAPIDGIGMQWRYGRVTPEMMDLYEKVSVHQPGSSPPDIDTWFDKQAYTVNPDGTRMEGDLDRFGTPQLKKISEKISQLEIPPVDTSQTWDDPIAVNRWISTPTAEANATLWERLRAIGTGTPPTGTPPTGTPPTGTPPTGTPPTGTPPTGTPPTGTPPTPDRVPPTTSFREWAGMPAENPQGPQPPKHVELPRGSKLVEGARSYSNSVPGSPGGPPIRGNDFWGRVAGGAAAGGAVAGGAAAGGAAAGGAVARRSLLNSLGRAAGIGLKGLGIAEAISLPFQVGSIGASINRNIQSEGELNPWWMGDMPEGAAQGMASDRIRFGKDFLNQGIMPFGLNLGGHGSWEQTVPTWLGGSESRKPDWMQAQEAGIPFRDAGDTERAGDTAETRFLAGTRDLSSLESLAPSTWTRERSDAFMQARDLLRGVFERYDAMADMAADDLLQRTGNVNRLDVRDAMYSEGKVMQQLARMLRITMQQQGENQAGRLARKFSAYGAEKGVDQTPTTGGYNAYRETMRGAGDYLRAMHIPEERIGEIFQQAFGITPEEGTSLASGLERNPEDLNLYRDAVRHRLSGG